MLADRGTWLVFKNRADLAVLVEGDKRLFNQYGVMVVNPAKHPHVKTALRAGLRRLGGLAGRAGRDRGLQDRRRAAVLPQRRRLGFCRPGRRQPLARAVQPPLRPDVAATGARPSERLSPNTVSGPSWRAGTARLRPWRLAS